MKFLFIVQGEGRGHLTQAIALKEILGKNGHEVVGMLVGMNRSQDLPAFFLKKAGPIVERFESPHFAPTLSYPRMNLSKSVLQNICRIPAYLRSIRFLKKKIEESQADRVVNFYEMLTGFTYLFRSPTIPQICVGHQYLFLHRDFKFPAKNKFSGKLLKIVTQITCLEASGCLALSFQEMKEDPLRGIRVVPPLLRKEVLNTKPSTKKYIHGYMVHPGFAPNIRDWHTRNPEVDLRFFWNQPPHETVSQTDPTLRFHALDDASFLESLAGCMGYATTAGFESVCEAMYFGKPVLMVPAHIEQDCNAWDAARIGAGIVSDEFNLEKLIAFSKDYRPVRGFESWVKQAEYKLLYELEKEFDLYDAEYSEIPVPGLFPA